MTSLKSVIGHSSPSDVQPKADLHLTESSTKQKCQENQVNAKEEIDALKRELALTKAMLEMSKRTQTRH